MARHDRVGERCSGSQSGAGEEHEDPELTEHEVGSVWNLPRDRSGPRHDAKAESDDQRAARGTQLDVPARQWHGDRADEQTGGDPEGETTRIDFGDPPLRVAEQSGHRIQLIDWTNHTDSIAQLEHGVVTGDTIVIAPAQPRRHDAES